MRGLDSGAVNHALIQAEADNISKEEEKDPAFFNGKSKIPQKVGCVGHRAKIDKSQAFIGIVEGVILAVIMQTLIA